jgi:hypothetical protein
MKRTMSSYPLLALGGRFLCALSIATAGCDDGVSPPPVVVLPADAAPPVAVPRDADPQDAAPRDVAPPPSNFDAPKEAGAPDGPPAATCPAPPAELECQPVMGELLPPAGTRTRQCAFDVGSTNVKLLITSTAPGDRTTLEGERFCQKAMRLGDRVVDAMMMPKPFAEADMDALVAQLEIYGGICRNDGGMILGAVATQWARTATNPDEIKSWFMAKMGMPLHILTGDQEGAYGYAAATHDRLDRIILDAGGRSFQLAYLPTGEPKPTSVSIRFGHNESSAKVWTRAEFSEFAPARLAYIEALKRLIAETAGAPEALARLGELVGSGKLEPELISLGDSGVILAVQGKLQDETGRWVDPMTYLQRVEERRRELAAITDVMGPKKTLEIEAVEAFLGRLTANPSWFEELRSECIRNAYGAKVLGHLTLLSHLVKEYGLGTRVVFTSGEMGEGFILEKLR